MTGPLGPNSPLRDLVPSRHLQHEESHIQRLFVELCVGRITKGQRELGAGLTRHYPELYLLYAIPNGGARTRVQGGILKAEGVLAAMPDLCLPAPGGPFHALYLEFKRPKEKPTKAQRELHLRLFHFGNAVVVVSEVQQALEATIGYLTHPAIVREALPLDGWQAKLELQGKAQLRRGLGRALP